MAKNICIHTHGCQPINGQIVVSMEVDVSTGLQIGADVPIDFASSVTQMNNAIIAKAKQVLADNGQTFASGDKIALFGGITSLA